MMYTLGVDVAVTGVQKIPISNGRTISFRALP